MSETEDRKMFEDFLQNKDLGKVELTTPLTVDERKLTAIVMGMQMAILQFVKEGLIEPKEQIHFMLHLNEYANMIYEGKEIIVNGQTMNLTSKLSKVFLDSANISLTDGKKAFDRVRELAKQPSEETNKVADFDGDNVMPGDLDKSRTLN